MFRWAPPLFLSRSRRLGPSRPHSLLNIVLSDTSMLRLPPIPLNARRRPDAAFLAHPRARRATNPHGELPPTPYRLRAKITALGGSLLHPSRIFQAEAHIFGQTPHVYHNSPGGEICGEFALSTPRRLFGAVGGAILCAILVGGEIRTGLFREAVARRRYLGLTARSRCAHR